MGWAAQDLLTRKNIDIVSTYGKNRIDIETVISTHP